VTKGANTLGGCTPCAIAARRARIDLTPATLNCQVQTESQKRARSRYQPRMIGTTNNHSQLGVDDFRPLRRGRIRLRLPQCPPIRQRLPKLAPTGRNGALIQTRGIRQILAKTIPDSGPQHTRQAGFPEPVQGPGVVTVLWRVPSRMVWDSFGDFGDTAVYLPVWNLAGARFTVTRFMGRRLRSKAEPLSGLPFDG
jgi:hypothetical protein